jgi:group II intron reverse transcriptase/maturase
VVEVDLAGCFDTIDHELLRRLVARRISDRRVFTRLRQWRTVGVVEEGQWDPTTMGSPQGGVISPVLAHIYLHVLDRYWTPQDRALGHLPRDADDRLIVCRTRGAAEQALQAVTQVLQTLKRTGHPTKTRIVDVKRAGCECLGFHVHKGRARTSGKLIPLMWPGQQAMQAIRRHIREQTERRGWRGTLTAIVATLNPIIRGWRHYCRGGHSTTKFQDLDRYGRQRVGPWERARLQRAATAGHLQARLRTSGLESFSARGRGGTRP